MSDSISPAAEAAIAEYLERIDAGEPVDRAAFVRSHADIADELRSYFESEDLVDRDRPADDPDTVTNSLAVDETAPPKSHAIDGGNRLSVPGTFGRYELEKLLGQGAMGSVYLATDTQLSRQVALKIPKTRDSGDSEFLARFQREARSAATLSHVNICSVYDVGEFEGTHFISMEFIEGRPLSDYIAGKLQPVRQGLKIVRKLAAALGEAHRRGVVHRDVKPDNVMIAKKGGEPIVMDFGLARHDESGDLRATQSGGLMGTPAYMAPEQIDGESDKVGPPSDQYSLGVVLYELLTGELPFKGSLAAVLGQIVTKSPDPPSKRRPEVTPDVEAVCLRMLAKAPEDRFESMAAVVAAITDCLSGSATATLPLVTGDAGKARQRSKSSEESRPTEDRESAIPFEEDRVAGSKSLRGIVPIAIVGVLLLGGVTWGVMESVWSATSDTTETPETVQVASKPEESNPVSTNGEDESPLPDSTVEDPETPEEQLFEVPEGSPFPDRLADLATGTWTTYWETESSFQRDGTDAPILDDRGHGVGHVGRIGLGRDGSVVVVGELLQDRPLHIPHRISQVPHARNLIVSAKMTIVEGDSVEVTLGPAGPGEGDHVAAGVVPDGWRLTRRSDGKELTTRRTVKGPAKNVALAVVDGRAAMYVDGVQVQYIDGLQPDVARQPGIRVRTESGSNGLYGRFQDVRVMLLPHEFRLPNSGRSPLYQPVDLASFSNRTLEEGPPGRLRNGMDLSGTLVSNGVPFEIGNRFVLTSVGQPMMGLDVNEKAAALHILHTAGGGGGTGTEPPYPVGTPLGTYRVIYMNRTFDELRLRYGKEVRCYYDRPDRQTASQANVAWTGRNPNSEQFGANTRLFHYEWRLSQPGRAIKSFDVFPERQYPGNGPPGVPMIVAMTVERSDAPLRPLPTSLDVGTMGDLPPDGVIPDDLAEVATGRGWIPLVESRDRVNYLGQFPRIEADEPGGQFPPTGIANLVNRTLRLNGDVPVPGSFQLRYDVPDAPRTRNSVVSARISLNKGSSAELVLWNPEQGVEVAAGPHSDGTWQLRASPSDRIERAPRASGTETQEVALAMLNGTAVMYVEGKRVLTLDGLDAGQSFRPCVKITTHEANGMTGQFGNLRMMRLAPPPDPKSTRR